MPKQMASFVFVLFVLRNYGPHNTPPYGIFVNSFCDGNILSNKLSIN